MNKKEIASTMKFAETIYSFYKYGYRWWGVIANEIIERIGNPFVMYAYNYRIALKAYESYKQGDITEKELTPVIDELNEAKKALYSAILHSGIFSIRYYSTSLAVNSVGRKVGLYEIIRRIRDKEC